MKLYNRNFIVSDRIEYMGWVNEGILNNNQPWQSYKPRFLALKGTDLMLFDVPPVSKNISLLKMSLYIIPTLYASLIVREFRFMQSSFCYE